MTLPEIEATALAGLECEVFALNDGCAFEEGTCATTHAFGPYCIDDHVGSAHGRLDERYEFWKWTLNNCGCQTSRGYTLGPCGLCALPRLAKIGVASLKVVGREAPLARKVASVHLAAVAQRVAAGGGSPEAIRDAVIALRGAPELCRDAHLCYYPDVWAAGAPKEKRRVVRRGARSLCAGRHCELARGGGHRGRRHEKLEREFEATFRTGLIVLNSLWRFTPHLSGKRRELVTLFALGLAGAAASLATPLLGKAFVDAVASHGDFAAVPAIAAALVGLAVLDFALATVSGRVHARRVGRRTCRSSRFAVRVLR